MEEEKTTNINIKNESHSSGKMGFFAILGIILIILFLVSLFIDIQSAGLVCIKTRDCKPLTTEILSKFFLVDYHITQETLYLKEHNIITNASVDSTTIIPERTVRTDLFVNVFFYIILLLLVIYLGYIIGGRGLIGLLACIFGLAAYLVGVIIVTGILVKEIYIPFTAFKTLFLYMGAVI